MNMYAVYVRNANGWDRECPSSQDVFFGHDHGGMFVRWASHLDGADAKLNLGDCGFVIIEGHAAAVALRDKLNSSGDWTIKSEDGQGTEARPYYSLERLKSQYTEA